MSLKYRIKTYHHGIEAVQYTGKNHDELREFAGKALALNGGDILSIMTPEGEEMFVKKYDYVIKGKSGVIYTSSPAFFEGLYEVIP